ncbi:MAG: hypothetical protein ACE5I9_08630 [Candidatus Methylomirabilales bacterium]
MESKELLYTSYRLLELKGLLPEGLSAAEREEVEELVEKRDDVGFIAFLEQLNLPQQSQERLRIIKEARPIALKIVELWREMPLRHEEIEEQYKHLQRLKAAYDGIVPRRVGAQFF